ncbi:hypothetical protein D3C76_1799450 [compost metagenome]
MTDNAIDQVGTHVITLAHPDLQAVLRVVQDERPPLTVFLVHDLTEARRARR